MKAYFSTSERIAKLYECINKWTGTPWVPNSAQPGRGVSCHNLPRAIYMECGALGADFPEIVGDPNATRWSKESKMIPFLDSRTEFERVALDQIATGDLIGIRIYKCVDHLGVVVRDKFFLHVLMHKHTCIELLDVPPWPQRIEAAWRIVER